MPHLDPERLHSAGAPLVDGEAVREVYDLVLGAVDHEDRRHHARDLVDTETGPD